MDESQDLEHNKAGCFYQHQYFKDIISNIDNFAEIKVFNTYEENINNFHYDDFDVFLWTGGLGNIYLSNNHNRDQLYVCEKILKLNKPLWGSCWGLQVVATCFGDKIVKTNKSELGFAENINILQNHQVYKNKDNFFTAPGHHYDHLEDVNSEFEIISQNDISIQSISHKTKNIFCTQYHPELPYNFIGALMYYWKNNYLEIFTEEEFDKRIELLNQLELNDKFNRKIELKNWLKNF